MMNLVVPTIRIGGVDLVYVVCLALIMISYLSTIWLQKFRSPKR